jgi:hypothetical protein
MSNSTSDTQAENGQLDSAPVAPSILAACSSQQPEKLIHEKNWHNPDSPDFHERFTARQYSFPDAAVSDLPSSADSESITSSMAALSISASHSSAFTSRLSAGYPPSLISQSTLRSHQSARTSRADSFLNLETLDENADGTSDGANIQPHRVLPCCFSFLSCTFESRNLEQWDTHCKSHFRGRVPRFLDCPFRCDWTREAATGEEAWQARMIHIWSDHGLHGLVDTGRKPSSLLIHHLWKEDIIDRAQVKELRTTGRLSGSVYLSSAGQFREDRIRRRSRA